MRMLGHASITLTVDTYGKSLPMGNKAAVDRLDEAVTPPGGGVVAEATTGSPDETASEGSANQTGGEMVAETATARPDHLQVVDGVGDPPWTRTMNPEIKSLLLYQLS